MIKEMNKTVKKNVWLILLATILVIAGYVIGKPYLLTNKTSQQLADQEKTYELPSINTRISSGNSYSDWKIYTDKSGHSFSYPFDWYMSDGSQIMNWDVQTVNQPGPLGRNDAKWDISFPETDFINLQDFINKNLDFSDTKIISLESSTTIDNQPVYFLESQSNKYGGYFISAIINISPNKALAWHGVVGSKENTQGIETLKQIAESVKR